MVKRYFIGVDGGATKCVLRLEDEAGELIGRAISGPANIRISVDQAWDSINAALDEILSRHSLSLSHPESEFHLAVGIAGCEIEEAYQAFMSRPHPFKTLVLASDAHTACLGAHRGRNGAIVIVGTGVVGYCIEGEKIKAVGGWGFPHDDVGGGAWLGLQAVSRVCKVLDGRAQASALTSAVMTIFQDDSKAFVVWANQANSTKIAELAPYVIKASESGDESATEIIKLAAQEVELLARCLLNHQGESVLPCALVGSVAPFLIPYFSAGFRSSLHACQSPPEVGAILMLRQYLEKI